jgi:hypothetical protein
MIAFIFRGVLKKFQIIGLISLTFLLNLKPLTNLLAIINLFYII